MSEAKKVRAIEARLQALDSSAPELIGYDGLDEAALIANLRFLAGMSVPADHERIEPELLDEVRHKIVHRAVWARKCRFFSMKPEVIDDHVYLEACHRAAYAIASYLPGEPMWPRAGEVLRRFKTSPMPIARMLARRVLAAIGGYEGSIVRPLFADHFEWWLATEEPPGNVELRQFWQWMRAERSGRPYRLEHDRRTWKLEVIVED